MSNSYIWERIAQVAKPNRIRGMVTWTFWESRETPGTYMATRTDAYMEQPWAYRRDPEKDVQNYTDHAAMVEGYKLMVDTHGCDVIEPLTGC